MDEHFKGIWPPFEAFYIESMLFNTSSARDSLEIVASVIQRLHEREEEYPYAGVDTRELLNQLQNFVLHAGAISKYFWPIRKGHEERGDQLRMAFHVSDQSPLKSRALRDAMEHFDEKLDRYLGKGIVGYVLPEYFGPKPSDAGVPEHLFRAYFVDTGEFQLLGESFEVPPLVDEMKRVHERLEELSSNGGRLRPIGG